MCDDAIASVARDFELGQIVATPAALAALERAGQTATELLARHARGDWGELSTEDAKANDDAVVNIERILSSYSLVDDTKIWIITEADRSVTTILLPEDY